MTALTGTLGLLPLPSMVSFTNSYAPFAGGSLSGTFEPFDFTPTVSEPAPVEGLLYPRRF